MFKIGDFSKLNKISVKALKYYDNLGLLKLENLISKINEEDLDMLKYDVVIKKLIL